jgi:ankyrin repeat protein
MTVLHWASAHGHLPSVDALIKAGASLNIQTNDGRWAFCGGAAGGPVPTPVSPFARRNTPLHTAAHYDHADVAAALINAGADMNIQNNKWWAFAAVRPVRRVGPVPTPVPPLPAGTRRCTVLPNPETPPQRPCSSTPPRT